jgi:hypothetical protein
MVVAVKQSMVEKRTTLPQRLQRMAIFILIAGLLAAALIHAMAAPDDADGAIGYEFVGGNSYAIMPGDSRRYDYELERMGGKSAVLAAEFTQWFGSLWRGRKLAGTLAILSVGSSLGCFFLAHLLKHSPPPDGRTGSKDA